MQTENDEKCLYKMLYMFVEESISDSEELLLATTKEMTWLIESLRVPLIYKSLFRSIFIMFQRCGV